MLCKIADLITSVPASGDLSSRCRGYLVDGQEIEAEIVIDEAKYRLERYPNASKEIAIYLESGAQFYVRLLDYDGIMLHASATVIDGETYLFAGQCCIGKSTHARLLKELRPDALFLNDDKPALRCIDGTWFAYGTPWCGKDGINTNARFPVKAVCLLTTRRDRNDVRLADPFTAAAKLISCAVGRGSKANFQKLAPLLDRFMRDIPIYEMDSLADRAAAEMAFGAMKNGL